MTPAAPSLDAVDRAFLWHRDHLRTRSCPDLTKSSAKAVESDVPPATASRPLSIHDDGVGSVVDRLLRMVPQDFERLAQRVEQAHQGGACVIAITGARRGEGRTTLTECLARTLMKRGCHVECHSSVPLAPSSSGRYGDSVMLVDPGVWFPGGPLRRSWLEKQSLGCHAVILVRRADQPACEARPRLLESIGLRVLGEVLTMAPVPSLSFMVS